MGYSARRELEGYVWRKAAYKVIAGTIVLFTEL